MTQINKRPLKRFSIILTVIVLIVALVLGSFLYLNSQRGYVGNVESLIVGMEPNQVNLLVYVAENQSYLAANGLNVTIKDYASGSAAVNGLLNGEVNVATSTEFVVANNALANQGIQTFGVIDKFLQIYVIGNKDRGIENVTDLAGKKVGLSVQTASEFYLGRFLELNGMDIDQISLVNVTPSQVEDALENGTVDAVVAWQPYVGAIENRLGNSTVMWDAQSGQVAFDCAVSTNNWISSNPELVKRFLNSLAQAEQYIIYHPAEAKIILQNRLNLTAAYVEKVWSQYRFSLSLDQSLILAMQDESRWLIQNNLTNATAVPNFLNCIYVNGLKSVEPESVNIIG